MTISPGNDICQNPLVIRVSRFEGLFGHEPGYSLYLCGVHRGGCAGAALLICRKELVANKTNLLTVCFPETKTEQKILLIDVDLSRENTDATASTSSVLLPETGGAFSAARAQAQFMNEPSTTQSHKSVAGIKCTLNSRGHNALGSFKVPDMKCSMCMIWIFITLPYILETEAQQG